MINDVYQLYGSDIAQSAGGGLMFANEAERGKQRILRRLLTNPGDYSFHPEYGAGLPGWIGKVFDAPKVRALIRGQILLEDSVAKTPEPQITVQEIPQGISCSITYTDSQTNAPQLLSFNVKV